MTQEVYILGESPTRDGLNLDYICKDKTSLTKLAEKCFKERFDPEDKLKIQSVKTNDVGDIEIKYSDCFGDGSFKQYYYLKKALK